MASEIIQVPEEFRARFQEAVDTDNKIQDMIQEAKLKRDALWLEIAQKLDVRDKALMFDKTDFTITISDKNRSMEEVMLETLRKNSDTPSESSSVGLDESMGAVLPQIRGLKAPLKKRIKDFFKR